MAIHERRKAVVLLGTAIVASTAMVLAGCGSSGSSSSGGGNSTSSTSGGTGATGATGTPPKSPTTAAANQYGPAIPVSDQAGTYGVTSNKDIYQGAGGYTLNISKCPSGWSNTQGISNTAIKLYATAPLSGPDAVVGDIDKGVKSYFEYVNTHGGIGPNHLAVDYTIGDDQYNPALTAQDVRAAMETNSYAAMPTITGSSNNLAVRSLLNSDCMPQFLTTASDPEFGDPQHYPWTSGFGLTYFGQAQAWAGWIKQTYPNGATVAEISADNSFGEAYHAGLVQALQGSNVKIVSTQYVPATASDIGNEMTTAAATKATVLVLEETDPFCTQGIQGAESGSWKPVVIMSQACAAAAATFAPLTSKGVTGAGTLTDLYYNAPTDSNLANPWFASLLMSTLKSQGLPSTNAEFADGWMWGWYVTEVLQDAASYRGGLNRANIMTAAYSIDEIYPLMVKGIDTQMDGMQNAFLVQSDQMWKYSGNSGSATGTYAPAGSVITLPCGLGTWTAIVKASPLAAKLVGT
jgi:branched-chain amino acid transport system substrate-binding protein